MVVGNVYYVTSGYNENKFKALLEKQLTKSSAELPSPELIEQAIAAYLACKDSGVIDNAVHMFKLNLHSIQYIDKRDYCGNQVSGEPLDAVKAYNQLVMMRKLG